MSKEVRDSGPSIFAQTKHSMWGVSRPIVEGPPLVPCPKPREGRKTVTLNTACIGILYVALSKVLHCRVPIGAPRGPVPSLRNPPLADGTVPMRFLAPPRRAPLVLSCPRRSRPPGLERLEGRTLLSGSVGTFARLGPAPSGVAFQVRPADFTTTSRGVVLLRAVHPADAPGAATAALRLNSSPRGAARVLHEAAAATGAPARVFLGQFGPGSFRLSTSTGVGLSQIVMSLAGDVDGNFRVNNRDLDLIRRAQGRRVGGAGYSKDLDVDLNGVVNARDLALAGLNLGAATSVRPLTLTAALSAASDPDGDGVVNGPNIDILGRTRPGTRVGLDRGPDGQADFTTNADSLGAARFKLEVSPGQTRFRLRADDRFGQSATTEIGVTYVVPTRPTLSIGDATQAEGNSGSTSFSFTVRLSSASASDVTVPWSTAGGTAVTGVDFVSASGILVVPAGRTTGTITVLVRGDTTAEPDETFFVDLGVPTGARIDDGRGLGTILNDDSSRTLSISDATQAEGNSGSTSFSFTVRLSSASSSDVTVPWSTSAGSAAAGVDFVSANGILVVPAGQTTGTITVLIRGDTTAEPDENFFVDLGVPTGAAIADDQGLGTIVNDDTPPAVDLSGAWALQGRDLAGTNWLAELVVQEVPSSDGGALSGYFNWHSTDFATYGREYFTGTYTASTRLVHLRGERLENAQGIVLGMYDARLDPTAMVLLDGSWSGGINSNDWTAARARATESTFDTGLDGWRVLPSPTNTLTLVNSGGDPGGYARVDDVGQGGQSSLSAGAKFAGSWQGGTSVPSLISFDFQVLAADEPLVAGPIFQLSGPGGTARLELPTSVVPGNGRWRTFVFALETATWTVTSGSLAGLLGNVSSFTISTDYTLGPESIAFDNVRLLVT